MTKEKKTEGKLFVYLEAGSPVRKPGVDGLFARGIPEMVPLDKCERFECDPCFAEWKEPYERAEPPIPISADKIKELRDVEQKEGLIRRAKGREMLANLGIKPIPKPKGKTAPPYPKLDPPPKEERK